MWYGLDCVKVEEEFELCLPDGEVTVHGAVGASELINTAKSGIELRPTNPPSLCLWQGAQLFDILDGSSVSQLNRVVMLLLCVLVLLCFQTSHMC